MIKPFKFFQKNIKHLFMSRYLGQLQWMYRPVGVIFYMERTKFRSLDLFYFRLWTYLWV